MYSGKAVSQLHRGGYGSCGDFGSSRKPRVKVAIMLTPVRGMVYALDVYLLLWLLRAVPSSLGPNGRGRTRTAMPRNRAGARTQNGFAPLVGARTALTLTGTGTQYMPVGFTG